MWAIMQGLAADRRTQAHGRRGHHHAALLPPRLGETAQVQEEMAVGVPVRQAAGVLVEEVTLDETVPQEERAVGVGARLVVEVRVGVVTVAAGDTPAILALVVGAAAIETQVVAEVEVVAGMAARQSSRMGAHPRYTALFQPLQYVHALASFLLILTLFVS